MVLPSAFAGGSGETVKIKSFKRFEDTAYELIVTPLEGKDYIYKRERKICTEFTVLGDFTWNDFFDPMPHLSSGSHLEALKFIEEKAQSEDKEFFLGSMAGHFYGVDKKKPCTVKSRGLYLARGEMVFSHYRP